MYKINKTPQNVHQTLKYMQEMFPAAVKEARPIANELMESYDPIQDLYHLLKKGFKYKADPEGMELIRSPKASVADRKIGIDCEDFSLMAAAILYELGYYCKYRIVDFTGSGWDHIYVVVFDIDKTYILDPVHDQFNVEDKFIKSKDCPLFTSKLQLGKQLGSSKNEYHALQIGLYYAKKELAIHGLRNGAFGLFNSPEDKARLAKVRRLEEQYQLLKMTEGQKGLAGTTAVWSMTKKELQNNMNDAIQKRAAYEFGTRNYTYYTDKILNYRTELKMREDNQLSDDEIPDTYTMLKRLGLKR